MLKALIFDCDGVLVDTERDAHRVGFNRAFALAGIDADWSVELYAKLLLTAGGKERMRVYFDEFGWPDGVETGDAKDALILALHQTKTGITSDIVAELPVRPGVLRIIDEARAAGVRLGVCTTSNPKRELVAVDDERELALETLGLPASECVVVEDSRNGLLAATGAGIATLVTKSTYTAEEDFTEAARVVSELGDEPNVQVTLADLAALAS